MDGLEVTRLLAGPQVSNPIAVVVGTTFELDGYVYTALRHGACGFLLKRSGAGLLVKAVRAAAAGDALISLRVTVRLLQHLRRVTSLRTNQPDVPDDDGGHARLPLLEVDDSPPMRSPACASGRARSAKEGI